MITVNKLHTLTGHNDAVYCLAGTGEDPVFYSGSGDGMVVQWDLKKPDTGKLIAKLPNSVYALAIDPNSQVLAIGHNYEGIHFVNLDRKEEVGSVKLTKAAIFDLQFWENLLIACLGDGEVIFFDMDQMQVRSTIKASSKSARCCDVNPVTREVAVGYSDHKVRIIDLDHLTVSNELVAHRNSVFTVRYAPGYDQLVSGGRDAHIHFWIPREHPNPTHTIVAHMYTINHLDFSPDGKHFVTCSMDKSIKVWDTQGLKLLKVIDKARHAGHGTSVNKLLWTSHHDQLVSCSDDRTISVWDLEFNNAT